MMAVARSLPTTTELHGALALLSCGLWLKETTGEEFRVYRASIRLL